MTRISYTTKTHTWASLISAGMACPPHTHTHTHTHTLLSQLDIRTVLPATPHKCSFLCCSPTCCIAHHITERESIFLTFLSEKHLTKIAISPVNVTQNVPFFSMHFLSHRDIGSCRWWTGCCACDLLILV